MTVGPKTPLNVNGVIYDYPRTGGIDYGDDATNWAVAVTNGMLQRQGGSFPLTGDVNFGASFGLKSAYYSSRSVGAAVSGILRLSYNESITWKDGSAVEHNLTVDSGGSLTYDGVPISAGGTQTANKVLAGPSSGGAAIPTFRNLVNGDLPTVALSKGGTGQTTATASFNALAPTQASNSGKYLTTNGTNTSWATVNALPTQTGNAGKYLKTDGTTASWAAVLSGTYINILSYGADPTGVADSTTAIQNAINAASTAKTLVYVPTGKFKVSGAGLNNTSAPDFQGIVGDSGGGSDFGGGSWIDGTTLTGNCMNFTDVPPFFRLEQFRISGPGKSSGITSSGIRLPVSGGGIGVSEDAYIHQVEIRDFPVHGLYVQVPITSLYDTVIAVLCGEAGFYIDGGTSLTMISCYANACRDEGYYFNNVVYSQFNSCAADNCNISYHAYQCSSIAFNQCGNESNTFVDAAHPGIGYLIEQCYDSSTINNCWCYQMPNVLSLGIYLNSVTNFIVSGFNNLPDPVQQTWDIRVGGEDNVFTNCTNLLRTPDYALIDVDTDGALGTFVRNGTVATQAPGTKLDLSGSPAIPDANISRTGWSTSTQSYNSCTDAAGSYSMNATGTPTIYPTIKVTYTTAYSPSIPMVIVSDYSSPSIPSGWSIIDQTLTDFTVQFDGTPAAGQSYGFNYLVAIIA